MRFDDDDVGFHQEEEHCVGGGWEQLDWLAGQTFANGVVSFFFFKLIFVFFFNQLLCGGPLRGWRR